MLRLGRFEKGWDRLNANRIMELFASDCGDFPFGDSGIPELNVTVSGIVDSTSSEARRRLTSMDTGAIGVIAAEAQSGGRGRSGKGFFSPRGGVYFTLTVPRDGVLLPDYAVTPAAAVAVCGAVEHILKLKPQIKWVNDVIYDGKKVCGILTEAAKYASGEDCLIIGIGVNCAVGAPVPKDLIGVYGELPISGAFRNYLIAQILCRLLWLTRQPTETVLALYRERSMMSGRRVRYESGGKTYDALANGIGDKGELLITDDLSGKVLSLTSGLVEVVGLYSDR